MTFRCDTQGLAAENRREYDSEAEALAAAEVLIRGGAKRCVVWEVGPAAEVGPESHRMGPRSDASPWWGLPATFDDHRRAVQALVLDAYRQEITGRKNA